MIQFRPCKLEDFDAVLLLLRQLWPDRQLDPKSLRSVFVRGLASESQAYLCAIDDGRVIGFGSLTVKSNLWQQGQLANVDELVIDNKHRNCGVGTELLNRLMSLAKGKGCSRIELDSAFHRKEAHAFYRRRGFEERSLLFSKAL